MEHDKSKSESSLIHPDAFIHPAAIVEPGAQVGARTRVWAWAHILSGAIIGDDCNICDHCFIENDVQLGNRVTVKCGVYLWDGVTVEDDVFIGPAVAFTNDKFPRSKVYPDKFLRTVLKKGASLGANSTILPVVIGSYSMVGAGSVVTKDVPDNTLVMGVPAKVCKILPAKDTKIY